MQSQNMGIGSTEMTKLNTNTHLFTIKISHLLLFKEFYENIQCRFLISLFTHRVDNCMLFLFKIGQYKLKVLKVSFQIKFKFIILKRNLPGKT